MIAKSQLPRVGRVSRFHALESLAHAVSDLDAPLADESRVGRDADATRVRLKVQRDDGHRCAEIESRSAGAAPVGHVRGGDEVSACSAAGSNDRVGLVHVQSMTPAASTGES
mgnify:CR=1 FL=1